MKTLSSQNNQLICTPIKEAYATTKQVGNLQMLNAPTGLVGLTVLMDGEIVYCGGLGGECVKAGSTVYVRAEQYTTDWAKKIKQCDEVKDKVGKPIRFIIVPGAEVVFVKKEEQPSSEEKPSLPDTIPSNCPNSACAMH